MSMKNSNKKPMLVFYLDFLLSFRGLSQYGLLHFGQTLGYSFLFRGIHSCPHRSHLNPSTVILILLISFIVFYYLVYKCLVYYYKGKFYIPIKYILY